MFMKIGIAVRKNQNLFFVRQSYCHLLEEQGHQIFFIYKAYDLSFFDGFLLPGGDDIHPKHYHEEIINCQSIEEHTDTLDQEIILEAYHKKKPLLGICRGIQSINVFLGGTLKQNIDYHMKENHLICFRKHLYLVNSFHHQSIAKLAENFLVEAVSSDGEIEIIRHASLPIIGVQFHPELTPTKLSYLLLEIFNEL